MREHTDKLGINFETEHDIPRAGSHTLITSTVLGLNGELMFIDRVGASMIGGELALYDVAGHFPNLTLDRSR